jgi:hypothetical protein
VKFLLRNARFCESKDEPDRLRPVALPNLLILNQVWDSKGKTKTGISSAKTELFGKPGAPLLS